MVVSDPTITSLKTWLNHAQAWLHEDASQEALQPPHRQMLDMMSQAMEENHVSRVWILMNEIETLTLHMTNTRELGEVFIRCAKIASDLENLKDALRLLLAAESKYKAYPHQHAVALWMVGCIHWFYVTTQRAE